MSTSSVPESAAIKSRFTDLFARITQKDDGHVFHNAAGNAVWGEENRRVHRVRVGDVADLVA
jgi:hypothetical protein